MFKTSYIWTMKTILLSNCINFSCCLLLTFTIQQTECQLTVDLGADLQYLEEVQFQIDSLRNLVEKLMLESADQKAQLKSLQQEKENEKVRERHDLTTPKATNEEVSELRRLFNTQQEQLESVLRWNVTQEKLQAQFELRNREQNEEIFSLRTQLSTLNSSLQQQLTEQRLQLEEQNRQISLLLRTSIHQEERLLTFERVNNSVHEVVDRQRELNVTLTEMNRTVEIEISWFKEKNRVHSEQLMDTNSSLFNELNSQIRSLRQDELSKTSQQQNATAVTYVRWGRKVCPQNSTAVYSGYGGGSHFSNSGGGSNYLCLPIRPQWGTTIDGMQNMGSQISGLEYELTAANSPFSTSNNGGIPLNNMDAPCILCQVSGKSSLIMIPAMRECPSGWYLQYRGYLASSHHSHSKMEYVCVDEAPEASAGSHRNDNGALFYPVEAACGSLPCPNYHAGWELACVVCAK